MELEITENEYRRTFPLTSALAYDFSKLTAQEKRGLSWLAKSNYRLILDKDKLAWAILRELKTRTREAARAVSHFNTRSKKDHFVRLLRNALELPELVNRAHDRAATMGVLFGVIDPSAHKAFERIGMAVESLRQLSGADIDSACQNLNTVPRLTGTKKMDPDWRILEKPHRGSEGQIIEVSVICAVRDMIHHWHGAAESKLIRDIVEPFGIKREISNLIRTLRQRRIKTPWILTHDPVRAVSNQLKLTKQLTSQKPH